ncbi:MAG: phosphate acetyltransferase [Actinomyces urogenitalis]|uniref:phosphate acetyltransferase n=1 Tax=Actinomyces urogenitalis TaxID=103621 RepID=UPI000660AD42|nr:phosphate acetyltransferase [Actinomyces urogenitalis]MBS6071200.1 phosphate acetyltransferase [Actinomyces urogenitalis]MDK8834663.1 phosphate acetyltransferase [Actinomyces urogenitalis]MDU0865355.1 phosphate acetyltransferase [Actinomyces urogenitalis]MDU0874403.1 phosphate acetyltransferase [Actinomyces urogenitalis]MDU1563968.1 phosphate acetyltransferase [Actinomyces urogenitalis]
MARSIYIASPSAGTGKTTVALGLIASLTKVVAKVGVFRPFVATREQDPVLGLLLSRSGSSASPAACVGVTWDEFRADPEEALTRIVDSYRAMAREHDVVIIDGSDFDDVAGTPELSLNARVAANIGAPVLLVVSGDQSAADVRSSAEVSIAEIAENHARTVAVLANRCQPGTRQEVASAIAEVPGVTTTTLPEVPFLTAPTLREIATALDASLIAGDDALLDREAESLLVGAMDVSHLLERLVEGQVVITPADRSAVLISLAAANAASGFPNLAALVLNGGFEPAPYVLQLLKGLDQPIPVLTTALDTFEAAKVAGAVTGSLAHASDRKIDVAVTTFEQEADLEALLSALEVEPSDVVTPIMFQAELVERARADRRTIVLPEPDDDRILHAADAILRRGISDVVLLGEEETVRTRATELGLDIAAARVVSTSDPELLEKYAAEFARLRAKKGVTLEQAREKVQDVSYFGTMMVHMGDADGMVSGAAHTTAHTIVPSFQIIKTKPGTSIVSSVFLMLLEDRVLVYGDCAVNPEPTAAELADIAISSAETARQFGVEPRVAMLSFSTGTSGKGADVDKVREATEIVRAKAPELAVEGPIQYDAAIDPTVAAKKAPGSAVAGKATVFIFPDLSAGNIGYKAVQRSSGAVAIGPVLQGLNKPVNDLSRGALVEDIINTVAITAVQAQG